MPPEVAVAPAEAVPSAPASAPDESQPHVSPPASEPASDAPVTTGAQEPPPVDTGEPKPASDQELPELSSDDVDALFTLYGPKFREHPEFKELIAREAQSLRDREKAEAAKSPQADQYFNELVQSYQGQDAAYAERVEALRLGEDVDADELEQARYMGLHYGISSDRRGLQHVNEYEVKALLEFDKLDEKNPVRELFAKAQEEREAFLVDARRHLHQGDIAKANSTDAAAAATYLQRLNELTLERGIQIGVERERKRGEKQTEAVVHTTRSNTVVEAVARAQATARAGKANGSAGGNGEPTRSDAERLADPATPVADLMEIRSRQLRG